MTDDLKLFRDLVRDAENATEAERTPPQPVVLKAGTFFLSRPMRLLGKRGKRATDEDEA